AVLPLVIVGAVGAARSAVAAGRRPRFPGRLTRSRGSWWPRGPGGQDDRGPRLSGRLPRLESGPEPFWPAGPAGHGNTGPRAPRAGRAEPGDHRARTPGAWPACGYEIALTAAAIGSVAVAWAAARVLDAAGGFAARPLPFTLAPLSQLWTHARLTGWGILELYGANFLGATGAPGFAFACLH